MMRDSGLYWMALRYPLFRRPEGMPGAARRRLLSVRLLKLSELAILAGAALWIYVRDAYAWICPILMLLVFFGVFETRRVRRVVRRFEADLRADQYAMCLECGYSLRGLPERHRCPECGSPYDLQVVRRTWARLLRDMFDMAPWKCPRCGKKVVGVLDVCMHCQAERPLPADEGPG